VFAGAGWCVELVWGVKGLVVCGVGWVIGWVSYCGEILVGWVVGGWGGGTQLAGSREAATKPKGVLD